MKTPWNFLKSRDLKISLLCWNDDFILNICFFFSFFVIGIEVQRSLYYKMLFSVPELWEQGFNIDFLILLSSNLILPVLAWSSAFVTAISRGHNMNAIRRVFYSLSFFFCFFSSRKSFKIAMTFWNKIWNDNVNSLLLLHMVVEKIRFFKLSTKPQIKCSMSDV